MLEILLLALLIPIQSSEKIDTHSVFMRRNIVWKYPPKYVKERFVYTDSADIAVFSPTGEFALISCVLNRDLKTGVYWISYSDGYTLRKGTWERINNTHIVTKSRLVHLPTPISNVSLPGSEIEQEWALYGQPKYRIASSLSVHSKKAFDAVTAITLSRPGKYIPLSHLKGLDYLFSLIEIRSGSLNCSAKGLALISRSLNEP